MNTAPNEYHLSTMTFDPLIRSCLSFPSAFFSEGCRRSIAPEKAMGEQCRVAGRVCCFAEFEAQAGEGEVVFG
jgi:hypothetical protein